MATFESACRPRPPPAHTQRFPLRRLEPSVNKLCKVLEIDLNRLQHHKTNIQKFHALKQWDLLTKEQINSSRTVKKLKSTIRQLDQTREQVVPDDLDRFDDSVVDIREHAGSAIAVFLELDPSGTNLDPLAGVENGQSEETLSGTEDRRLASTGSAATADREARLPSLSDPDVTSQGTLPSTLPGSTVTQIQVAAVEDDEAARQAQQSWQELKNGLTELNGLIHIYHSTVQSQQASIDTIEENIESSQQNVEQGVISLATAAKLRTAAFPVAGAVLGTMVAGPVGLVAGLKLGGLAAVGGGIAGFGGGKILKNKQERSAEAELQNLSSRHQPEVVSEGPGARRASEPIVSSSCAETSNGPPNQTGDQPASWITNKLNNMFS